MVLTRIDAHRKNSISARDSAALWLARAVGVTLGGGLLAWAIERAGTAADGLRYDPQTLLREVRRIAATASFSVKCAARRRIETILHESSDVANQPARLQALRVIEVLEKIGSVEARRVLRRLAEGAPDCLVTREARGTLGRLDK